MRRRRRYAAVETPETLGEGLLSRYDSRLAYAVQQMASFGARSGEAGLSQRSLITERYDLHAS